MSPDDGRHGTYAGYQRHKKDGETACRPCRAANTEYTKQYRSDPTRRERDYATARASSRAAWRVVALHRAEFDRFYADELRAEGIRKPVAS